MIKDIELKNTNVFKKKFKITTEKKLQDGKDKTFYKKQNIIKEEKTQL